MLVAAHTRSVFVALAVQSVLVPDQNAATRLKLISYIGTSVIICTKMSHYIGIQVLMLPTTLDFIGIRIIMLTKHVHNFVCYNIL